MKILKSNQFIKQYETITTKTTIYIVSEYIFGEDLYEYVRKKKKLTEAEAAFLMGMIIEAVIHLHNIDIIHRDLKPENIMVTFSLFRFLIKRSRGKQETSAALPLTSCWNRGQRKSSSSISDLPTIAPCCKKDSTKVIFWFKLDVPVGTLGYMAPEVLLG